MRIDSLGRTVGGPIPARSGSVSSSAFSVDDRHEADQARQAAPLRSAPSLDGLMALQAFQEEGPRERRRRDIARGRGLLDVLDGLKLAVVEGRDDPSALAALAAQLGGPRASTGDAGLDDALSAIELRARVELAKRGA